jgi:hypothetical protein
MLSYGPRRGSTMTTPDPLRTIEELAAQELDLGAGIDVRGIERRILLEHAPHVVDAGRVLGPLYAVARGGGELGAASLEAAYIHFGEGDPSRSFVSLYRSALGGAAVDAATVRRGPPLAREPSVAASVGRHVASALLGPPDIVKRAGSSLGAGNDFHEACRGGRRWQRAAAAARRMLEAYGREPSFDPRSVAAAVRALGDERAAWIRGCRETAEPSPAAQMVDLVGAKARHARGHHAEVRLEGRTLDEWFDEAAVDARAFVDALARSRFVVPGAPERSPLATSAVAFGGRMFGVFTAEELAIVRAWIADLAAPERGPRLAAPAPAASRPIVQPTPEGIAPALDARAVFRRLVGGATDDGAVAAARAFVRRTLATARPSHVDWPRRRDDLDEWIDRRLSAQTAPSRHGRAEPAARAVTRQDVLWMLEQLLPAALVDGAWLFGASRPPIVHTRAGALLFRIYYDELGAGDPRRHHGNVMRRTLEAHGRVVPECTTIADDPRVLPAAFVMPALWLAMATVTEDCMPELLGLNLAIEMAGIGRGYRWAASVLRHHGVDPCFFDLHNTIDNASSGHTATSREAIHAYLDDLAAAGGAFARDEAWQRMARGFASYDVASRPLVRAIALRVVPRAALRWLRNGAASLRGAEGG